MTDRQQLQPSDPTCRSSMPFSMRVQAKRSTRIEGSQIVKEVQYVFDFGDGLSAASAEVRRFGFSEGNRSLMTRPEVLRNKPSTETYVWNTPSLTSADHVPAREFGNAAKELPSATRSSSRSSRASWMKASSPETMKEKEACSALVGSCYHKKSQICRRPGGFNCGELFDNRDNVITDQRKLSKSTLVGNKRSDCMDLRKEARALITRMKSRVSPANRPSWQKADDFVEIVSLDSDPKDDSKIDQHSPRVTSCDEVIEAATDVDEEDNLFCYGSASDDESNAQVKSMVCERKLNSPVKRNLIRKLSQLAGNSDEEEKGEIEPISDEDYPFIDEDYDDCDNHNPATDRTSNLDVDDLGWDADDDSRLTINHTTAHRKPFIFKKGFISSVFRTSSWSDDESSDNQQSHGYYSSPITRAQHYLNRNPGPSLVESFSKFFRKRMPWRYGRTATIHGEWVHSTPDLHQQGELRSATNDMPDEGHRPKSRHCGRTLPRYMGHVAKTTDSDSDSNDEHDVVVAYHHQASRTRSQPGSNSSSPDPMSKISKNISAEHGLHKSAGMMNMKHCNEHRDKVFSPEQTLNSHECSKSQQEDDDAGHCSSVEEGLGDELQDQADNDYSEMTYIADHNNDGNFGDDEYDPKEEDQSERSSSLILSESDYS